MIDDVIIVGAGFSAYCVASILGEGSSIKVISPSLSKFPVNFKRVKDLEFNRILSNKYQSYSNLSWNIGKNRLVDRLGLGGNSTIWGAALNLDHEIKNFRRLSGFEIVSMNTIAGIRSNKNLGVMIDSDKKLYSVNNYFLNNKYHINGFAINCKIDGGIVHLNYFDGLGNKSAKSKKLFLCLSVPQTLGFLISSDLIPHDSLIKLSEHKMDYRLHGMQNYPERDCVVSYKGCLALARALGLRSTNSSFLDLGPYCIDQIFTDSLQEMSYKLDVKSPKIESLDSSSSFGKSIHYFGMRINEVNLNSYLNSISPNLMAFGHSSIMPIMPGPIANDILIDVIEKLA